MNKNITSNILRFIVLATLQVFVLNNIAIDGFITPYIYVLYIILYPATMGTAGLLISSFAIGFIIDTFEVSGGIHAFASVFIAGVKPFLLSIMLGIPRSELASVKISSARSGGKIALIFLFSMIFIHHFILYTMEAFSLLQIFPILFGAVLNTLVSAVVCLIFALMTINFKNY